MTSRTPTLAPRSEFPTWLARLRDAARQSITEDDVREMVKEQVKQARAGDTQALRFVFDYILGGRSLAPSVTLIQNNTLQQPAAAPAAPTKAEPEPRPAEAPTVVEVTPEEIEDKPAEVVAPTPPAPLATHQPTGPYATQEAEGYADGRAGMPVSRVPYGFAHQEDSRKRQAWQKGWKAGAQDRAAASGSVAHA